MSTVSKVEVEMPDGFPLDDPTTLEKTIAKMAQDMLRDGDKVNQEAGLWLKYEASTFAAAIADFKRQDKSVGDALQAFTNAFISLFTRALFEAMNDDEIHEATMAAASNIAEVIVGTIAENCKRQGRKVKMPLPMYVTNEQKNTVH